MGDFKGLTGMLKTKETKYVMEAEKLKIGKGMLTYDDNILIPLRAISFVEIAEQEKNGPDAYALKIQNHAGTWFTITAPDLDAIKEIRGALMICMNHAGAVYSGVEGAVIAGRRRLYGEKIIEAGEIHINKTKRPEDATPEEKKPASTEGVMILDDEWKLLEEYSLKRMMDFPQKERNHTICAAMAAAAELHNREKCKKILQVSGNDALDMIIAGAPIAVKAIVNKLM
ncbi:MAG: hypothetical protein NC416_18745 [Eubacterium sp.]|nr:hypothetical protein [Eubacterium sp.]